MLALPWTDHAVANRLEDVAAALDAGLSAQQILTGPAIGRWSGPIKLDDGLVAALVARGAPLASHERAVLEAAETAGQLPKALLSRARARRHRAALIGELVRGLIYPAALVVMSLAVFGLVSAVAGGSMLSGIWFPLLLIALLTTLAGAVFAALRNPDFTGAAVPGLRGTLHDLAEVSYLEALGGLYSAGVPLIDAQQIALGAVPVAWVRRRLEAAGGQLATGDTGLVDALADAEAVCAETLHVLRSAEQSGDLEPALERAAERRRYAFKARSTLAVRVVGTSVYVLVVAYIAMQVLNFYAGYYGKLGGL